MTDWEPVRAAVQENMEAYLGWLKAQAETRQGGKKWKAALARWVKAHEERAAALEAAFDPEKDVTLSDGTPRLGSVLQRYYAETYEGGKVKKR